MLSCRTRTEMAKGSTNENDAVFSMGTHIVVPWKQTHVRLLEVLRLNFLLAVAGGRSLNAMHERQVGAIYPPHLTLPQAIVESARIEFRAGDLRYYCSAQPLPARNMTETQTKAATSALHHSAGYSLGEIVEVQVATRDASVAVGLVRELRSMP